MRYAAWGLLLPAVLSAGCGSGLGQVTGKVYYDGKPLKQGSIRFETTGARPATGNIVDGEIVEVMTLKPGDGVPLGSHKVAVFSLDPGTGGGPKNPGDPSAGPAAMMTASLIPAVYNDPAKSGLTAEIKSGPNEVRFDLKKNP